MTIRILKTSARLLAGAVLLLAIALPALAQEFDVNGFADFRLVRPSDQRSTFDGGLGKLRYGSDGSPGVKFEFAEIVADGRAQLTPDLTAMATLRYDPDQKTAVDFLEAYARYRPVPTGGFNWSAKVGAFFPPISFENEGVGWSSPWTLTPSAINTWVGEELRTLGAEFGAEWRFDGGSIEATGAVFGWNDPAGVLIADRGWALNDRPVGLIDNTRLPDAIGVQFHEPTPVRQPEIMEIDNEPGWYAGLTWRETGLGRISVLRYENRADPSLDRNEIYAWRTEFTSAGLETYFGDVTLMIQGMSGMTEIVPFPGFHSVTDFQSAFLLLGWDIGDWTAAARIETFATQNHHPGSSLKLSEHGHAFTLAGTWRPKNWLRLTAEMVHADSGRPQRIVVALDPDASETLLQLSARVSF